MSCSFTCWGYLQQLLDLQAPTVGKHRAEAVTFHFSDHQMCDTVASDLLWLQLLNIVSLRRVFTLSCYICIPNGTPRRVGYVEVFSDWSFFLFKSPNIALDCFALVYCTRGLFFFVKKNRGFVTGQGWHHRGIILKVYWPLIHQLVLKPTPNCDRKLLNNFQLKLLQSRACTLHVQGLQTAHAHHPLEDCCHRSLP